MSNANLYTPARLGCKDVDCAACCLSPGRCNGEAKNCLTYGLKLVAHNNEMEGQSLSTSEYVANPERLDDKLIIDIQSVTLKYYVAKCAMLETIIGYLPTETLQQYGITHLPS